MICNAQRCEIVVHLLAYLRECKLSDVKLLPAQRCVLVDGAPTLVRRTFFLARRINGRPLGNAVIMALPDDDSVRRKAQYALNGLSAGRQLDMCSRQ